MTFQTTFRIPEGSVLKYLCRSSAWPGGVPQVCAVRKKGFFRRTFRIVILVFAFLIRLFLIKRVENITKAVCNALCKCTQGEKKNHF